MSFFMRKILLPFRDSGRLVDAVDFDRKVHVTQVYDYIGLGFDEFTLQWSGNGDYAQFNPDSDHPRGTNFVLPAGSELWGAHSREDENGSPADVSVSIVVTKLG